MSIIRKRIVFICVFAAIALAETTAWTHWRQLVIAQQQQQQFTIETQQRAATEHADYLARYLNPNISKIPGTKIVAIAAANEDGRPNQAVTTAVAERLKSNSVSIFPSFFKPEFVTDGLLNETFMDSKKIFSKLELRDSLDAVLLARQSVRYSSNPSLQNVTTATMDLEVAVFPVNSSAESQSWKFTASGAGFKNEDARAMAEERLIEQIATDANMTLQL